MKEITVLGFDFGTKKIGVACGETCSFSTRPLAIVKVKNHRPNWEEIAKLIETWNPELLLVGLPLAMDGTHQEITKLAENFGRKLAERFNLPVEMIDERLSTRAAKWHAEEHDMRILRNKKPLDALAAEIIIQSWFEIYKKQ